MLAYVFWHRPAGGTDAADYERRLSAFHDCLRAEPPAGFAGSAAFRIDEPWIGRGYEDWYLVADWNAVGVLNHAAVDADHRPSHDAVAGDTADGAGGVYALRAGDLALRDAGAAEWSAKPRGIGYEQFEGVLAGGRDHATYALWQRQLVLGPAPEFCLLTPGDSLRLVTGA